MVSSDFEADGRSEVMINHNSFTEKLRKITIESNFNFDLIFWYRLVLLTYFKFFIKISRNIAPHKPDISEIHHTINPNHKNHQTLRLTFKYFEQGSRKFLPARNQSKEGRIKLQSHFSKVQNFFKRVTRKIHDFVWTGETTSVWPQTSTEEF